MKRASSTSARLSMLMSDKARVIYSDILILIGVLVLLFYVWYVWFGDLVAGIQQDAAASNLSKTWDDIDPSVPEFDRTVGDSQGASKSPPPPVITPPAEGDAFATLIIPRFGKTFERTIAESVDVKDVLNDPSTGVGHYASTETLGEVGNFALAGHRTTFGAPFGQVDRLHVGDRIYVETEEGWFVYRFRNMEYVHPTQSDVLNSMPRLEIEAKDRILTMTTCHPKLSAAERFISYSVFESFVPRRNGAPAEVAAMRTKP